MARGHTIQGSSGGGSPGPVIARQGEAQVLPTPSIPPLGSEGPSDLAAIGIDAAGGLICEAVEQFVDRVTAWREGR